MNLQHKIEIDILEFFKTGKFDYIKLGQTKSWILKNFSKPDSDYDNLSGSIWTYGNIEFHFSEDKLFLIYSDHFNNGLLSAGEHINLDRWIFEYPKKLKMKYVIEQLNKENIDYQKVTTKLNIEIVLTSGVKLIFENIKDTPNLDSNQYHLIAFAYKIKK